VSDLAGHILQKSPLIIGSFAKESYPAGHFPQHSPLVKRAPQLSYFDVHFPQNDLHEKGKNVVCLPV